MGAIIYDAEAFRDALLNYLPRGRAWPKNPDSVQAQVMLGLAQVFARSAAAGVTMISDALPSTTVGLLAEWQDSLGLPDACSAGAQTLQQEQAQCALRFAGAGGPSRPAMIALAASLGYAVTIEEFAPARAGVTCAGQPGYGEDWAFAWQINWQPAPGFDPINADLLSCELNRVAPAHTLLLFQRVGPPGQLDFDQPRQSALEGN